jgi:hypothetical protein
LWKTKGGEWRFSELPAMENEQRGNNIELSISFDEKDLSVGTARYTGSRHLNKNIAIHPGVPGQPGTPILHSNVQFDLVVDGKSVPMTVRRVRYWDVVPIDSTTVANDGKWEVDLKKGGYASPPGIGVPRAWDRPSRYDAPGMNPLVQPSKPAGDLHEFIAGNPKYGGYYYQVVTLYDPDMTMRVMVYNVQVLSAEEFVQAKKFFEKERNPHSLLLGGGLADEKRVSDTGVMTDIPDIVKAKNSRKSR